MNARVSEVLVFLMAISTAVPTARSQNPPGDGKPRIYVADKDGNNVKLLVEIPLQPTVEVDVELV